jgi:hypothetical protein
MGVFTFTICDELAVAAFTSTDMQTNTDTMSKQDKTSFFIRLSPFNSINYVIYFFGHKISPSSALVPHEHKVFNRVSAKRGYMNDLT